MTTLIRASGRSPWRVRAAFDSTFGGMTTAAGYTFVRADGAQTAVAVRFAFNVDTLEVELALAEALQPGVIYVLTVAAVTGSAQVSYVPPPPPPLGGAAADDPAAEAFGVDIDWTAQSLDATGDTPSVSGLQCLNDDLIAIALTEPGELYHRPTRGAGLSKRVNAPSDPTETQARVIAEWNQDDRVQSIQNARGVISTVGAVSVSATVVPIALPTSPLPVKVTNG